MFATTEEAGIVLWEVSEPLDTVGEFAFSPRPSEAQLGAEAVRYIQEHLVPELGIESPSVALFYQETTGITTADAFRRAWQIRPDIYHAVNEDYWFDRDAERIRDEDMTIIVTAMLDAAMDELWYGLIREDANAQALIYIGSEGVRTTFCSRYTTDEGVISVTATGDIRDDYYAEHPDATIFHAYERAYVRQNSAESPRTADLAASGTYLLLRHILPNADDFSAEGVRAAILSTDIPASVGYMGEGIRFEAAPENQAASIFVQQRQDGLLCSLEPGALSTCMNPVAPLMTWRDRALEVEGYRCYRYNY